MTTYLSRSILADFDYRALRQREIDAFAALPKALMYSPEDIRDPRVEGTILYTKILIHLEHLQNIFCIGRLLVQWGYDNHAELLQVSSKMVSATLMLWTHRDRLIGLHGDFEWLVGNVPFLQSYMS